MTDILLLIALVTLLVPPVVYVSVLFGTFAYMRAMDWLLKPKRKDYHDGEA